MCQIVEEDEDSKKEAGEEADGDKQEEGAERAQQISA
jgi:hypothetical protein